MKNLLNKAMIILLCCCGFSVFSQEQVVIESLDDAFKLALEANPDYQNYLLKQEQSEYEYKASRSYRFPTITGSFTYQNNLELATTVIPGEISGMPGETIEAQFGQQYNNNYGVSINKNLINRSSALQSKISKIQLEMSKAQTDSYEELLKQQVSLYYYSALIANRSVELNQKDLQLADSLLELTQSKYDEGVLDLLTVNSSKINSNNVERSLVGNSILYDQNIIELKKLFGLDFIDELVLKTDLIYDLPMPKSVSDLSPDKQLDLSSMNLEQSELQMKIQKAAYLPTITSTTYFGQQQFSDDTNLSFKSSNWSDYSYVGISLNVPIFSGFSRQNNLKSSKVALQIARNEQEALERSSKNKDLQLINQYNLSLRDTKVSKETFQLYQSNLELTFQQYEEGLVGLDQYLRVFEDYLKAEGNFLSSMSNTYGYYSQIISRSK